MSVYTSDKINGIAPYVPGEQPRDRQYIKLNTNENPYYTSERARSYITDDVLKNLKRYCDPESKPLAEAIAKYYGVDESNVLVTNGSDEALAFCFRAYGGRGMCYADVTYGFYDVFADMYDCPVEHIALEEDFTIDCKKYLNRAGRTIVIANPNAQTGIAVSANEIEKIVAGNRDGIVIVDQAYVDFFGQNVIPLIKKYGNLVVVNTFSKSRSLAGARVGFVIADGELIADLKKIKYSFHPYNVNTLSMLLAKGAIEDEEYFRSTLSLIKNTRGVLTRGLCGMGFQVLPSSANFVLARRPGLGGEELYLKLKAKGILVRHFADERIKDFIRITVGTEKEADTLLRALGEIIGETK